MADSDDEYEFGGGSRKRHNKFRNERDDMNDYGGGSGGGISSDNRYNNSNGGGSGGLSSMVASSSVSGGGGGGYNRRRDSREPGDDGRSDYRGLSRPMDSGYKNERSMGARSFHQGGAAPEMRRGGSMSTNPRYGGGGGGGGSRFDYYGRGESNDRYDYGGGDVGGGHAPSFNKRSFNGMPHHSQPYYGGGGGGGMSESAGYDDFPPQKKTRRDWSSVLDESTYSSSYFEHDNRSAAPDYDDYIDEFTDDYTRLSRPTNYSSYKYDAAAPDKVDVPGYYRPYSHQSSGGYSDVGPPKRFHNNYAGGGNNNSFHSGGRPYGQMGGGSFHGDSTQHSGGGGGGFNKFSNQNKMNTGVNHGFNSQDQDGDSPPQMMSFKQFLATLNSEAKEQPTAEVATQKYTEYKNNFRREQIARFFTAHKLEDWFKCRYHPKISTKRKEEQRETIKHRLDLFTGLLERYGSDPDRPLSLDMSDENHCTWLYRFLDAAMIRLEGGSEADLVLLEELYAGVVVDEEKAGQEEEKAAPARNGEDVPADEARIKSNMSDKESGVGSDDEIKESNQEEEVAVREEEEDKKMDEGEIKGEAVELKGEVVEGDLDQNGQLDIIDTIIEHDKDVVVKEEPEKTKTNEEEISEAKSKLVNLCNRLSFVNKLQQHLQKLNQISAKIPQKTQSIFFKHLPVIVTRQDLEEIGKKYEGFKRASISEPAPERRFQRRGWITFSSQIDIKDTCAKINGTKLYDMMLHVTVNRELDNKIKCVTGLINHKLAIQHDLKLITKVVENMDKRWGLWQHGAEYEARDAKKDQEAMEVTKPPAEAEDAANEAKADEGEAVESKSDAQAKPAEEPAVVEPVDPAKLELATRYNELYNGKPNPLLLEALDYLKSLEESEATSDQAKSESTESTASAEDAAQKTENGGEHDESAAAKPVAEVKAALLTPATLLKMEKDPVGARLLDRLILYLRLVHSIDFYNVTEYPQEDYMPNRCGALHVRASSENKNNNLIVSVVNSANINNYDTEAIRRSQLDEWMRLFDMNIRSYADYHERIDEDLAKKLGLKDLKTEVDKFVEANCQKVDKEIWLCPLSGKKFKSPEYVRKHIESKHADKLVDLEGEVDYFNRFVLDPKRPYLPEHPLLRNNSNNNQYNQGGNNWGGNNYNNYNSYNNNNNYNSDYRSNQQGYYSNRSSYGGGYNNGGGGYHDYGYSNNSYNNNGSGGGGSYYGNQYNSYQNRYNNNGRPVRRF